MAYWRFITLAAVGSVIWISGLALIGRAVGSEWRSWQHNLDYVLYALLAIAACAAVYVLVRRRQRPRSDARRARRDRTPAAHPRTDAWSAARPRGAAAISSSGHVTIVPWLLGWDDDLDDGCASPLKSRSTQAPPRRCSSRCGARCRRPFTRQARERRCCWASRFLPPAVVGYTLERPIERHLGTPATIATGLIAGALLMAWADRAPQDREARQAVSWTHCALASPRPARSCLASRATARRSRLRGCAASRERRPIVSSRHVALPVIAGATLLKGVRLSRRGVPRSARAGLALGAGASFASTLGSTWRIRQVERDRSLAPYAAYRIALGTLVLARLARPPRRNPSSTVDGEAAGPHNRVDNR